MAVPNLMAPRPETYVFADFIEMLIICQNTATSKNTRMSKTIGAATNTGAAKNRRMSRKYCFQ